MGDAPRRGSDRRRQPRAPFDQRIQLQCAGDPTWFSVDACDLSTGGLGVVSRVRLGPGEAISIWFPDTGLPPQPAVVRHAARCPEGWFIGIELSEGLPFEIERLLMRAAG